MGKLLKYIWAIMDEHDKEIQRYYTRADAEEMMRIWAPKHPDYYVKKVE